jgi:hypothetical protein
MKSSMALWIAESTCRRSGFKNPFSTKPISVSANRWTVRCAQPHAGVKTAGGTKSRSRLPLTLEADGRTAVLNALESGAAASVVAHDPTTSLRTRPCQVPHTGVHAPRGSSYSYSPSSEPLLSALLESTFGPTLLQYPSAPEGWFGKRGGQPCGLLLLSLPM